MHQRLTEQHNFISQYQHDAKVHSLTAHEKMKGFDMNTVLAYRDSKNIPHVRVGKYEKRYDVGGSKPRKGYKCTFLRDSQDMNDSYACSGIRAFYSDSSW
jgi:hypothetical protein